MSFKLPFILLVIGVGVAGVIPFGMSQVNEDAYMEIDMLPTQTVNPFSIQDENDVDVFSIKPDGSFGAGTWVTWKVDTDLGEAVQFTDCGFQDYGYTDVSNQTSPCVLAQLDIIQLTGTGESAGAKWWLQNGALSLNAQIKRDAGAGTCTIKMTQHDEEDVTPPNNTYSDKESHEVTGTLSTFSPDFHSMYQSFSGDVSMDIDSIRIVVDTGSAGTTCSFKSFGFIMELPDYNFLQYDFVKDGT